MQNATKTILTVGLSLIVTAWVAYPQPPAPSANGKTVEAFKGGGAKGGAKGKGKSLPEGPTPRMADGKPDLSGNWEPNAIQQNVNLARAMEQAGTPIPFLPAAKAISDKHLADVSKDDPESLCLPPGVPRMNTTPYPWTFVQTPKLLTIVYEGGAHVWRKVFLDGRPHDPNTVETWLGDSVGHWEGDTLVIETVGQTDQTWLDEGGVPHSSDMKVTERITRPDLAHLEIVNIIDDPKMFSKTWSFTTHPTLLNGELIEYICQENNRDVKHLVGK